MSAAVSCSGAEGKEGAESERNLPLSRRHGHGDGITGLPIGCLAGGRFDATGCGKIWLIFAKKGRDRDAFRP